MKLEFYEPAEAAALMKCSEAWLKAGAANGEFPHTTWGKGKIIFTSAHIKKIARLREANSSQSPEPTQRLIGTRARKRLA